MKYCLSKYTIKIDEVEQSVILYNTLYGGIIKLNKSEYLSLVNTPRAQDEIAHFHDLLQQGFIVYENTNEYFKTRTLLYQSQQTDLVTSVAYVIAPTLECNYNCVYCFENIGEKCTMTSVQASEIKDFILRQVDSNKIIKNVRVMWFGGEPLLAYDLIVDFSKTIIHELSLRGISYTSNMITNGFFLTRDKAICLASECNLINVQITLDGFEETYAIKKGVSKIAFHKVISNIMDACDYLKISIRLNADKSNFEEMCELAKYLLSDCHLKNKVRIYLAEIKNYHQENGWKCFQPGEFIYAMNQFNLFLKNNGLIDKYVMAKPPCFEASFCGNVKKYNFSIGPCGELYKCEHHFGISEKIIGDVKNGLYYNDAYQDFLRGTQNEECESCELSPCCKSDCMALLECHKKDGKCLIYSDLLTNLKKYVLDYSKYLIP